MVSTISGAYMAVGPTYLTGTIFALLIRDLTVSVGIPKKLAISLTVNSSMPPYRKNIKNFYKKINKIGSIIVDKMNWIRLYYLYEPLSVHINETY
jgi:uncharacterized membrane protein YgaE (UPF0421/DUF939 family)